MSLRRFNNFLSVVVVVLGLYISLSPFLPMIAFWFRDTSPAIVAPYVGALAENQGSETTAPPPEENRLVIPSISLNEEIFEGSNIWVINNGGTWRRPSTSTPDADGNTVIVGHRFFGNATATFYHLDKVSVGDRLAIYWDQEEIVYEVTEVKTVPATAVGIEAPTNDKRLTIYTCTPIWTAKNRLVVIAKPLTNKGEVER